MHLQISSLPCQDPVTDSPWTSQHPEGAVPPSADSSWPPLPLVPSAPGTGGLFRHSLTFRQCSSSWSALGSCREGQTPATEPLPRLMGEGPEAQAPRAGHMHRTTPSSPLRVGSTFDGLQTINPFNTGDAMERPFGHITAHGTPRPQGYLGTTQGRRPALNISSGKAVGGRSMGPCKQLPELSEPPRDRC